MALATTRHGLRVATLVALVLLACTSGCEAFVESLDEKCNPGGGHAHAHTLHNFDIYGNELPPR